LKDLLRGCIICDTIAESKKVFEVLTTLEMYGFDVVQVKNGFGSPGLEFDPTKYADIKIILKMGGEYFVYEELIEIQIIQRINLELKEIEHLL